MSENNEKSTGSAIGSIIGTIVLAAVCVAGGWIAKDMWPKGDGGAAAAQAAKLAAMAAMQQTVAVTNAEMRVYNLPERFVAHAEAVQEVDLLPQIDGYVREIKFKEGDVVKEGQVLYVIDDERYQAVANQRKADLAAAEAEARRAERYFERMEKADERGITQLERDNAEAAAEKAKAAVLQAKANLVVAEYDLKKTTVFAPISGQIGKSSAHVGDYVAPSKGALAKIVQIDPIRVSFPLTDRAYIAWRQAQREGKDYAFRMRLILPDGSEYDREGTWDFDDNQMSRETASIMMRLRFPNPERLLIPNSYVTLLTDYQEPPSYPSVPQQAIVDLPGGNQGVWILKDDMTVEQRPVETKEAFGGWTPLVKGVKEGERVVISGISKLGPGVKVALVQPTSNDDINANHKSPIEE
jgi:RND family efflux transporter MFP subunit